MTAADLRHHRRALDLAAAAVDFRLDVSESEELGAHLDACAECRRSAGALRADAAGLRRLSVPLPSRRVDDAVFGAIAAPVMRPQRVLVLVAATLLLVALLGIAAAGAVILHPWDRVPADVVPTAPAVPPLSVIVVGPGPIASPTAPTDSLPIPRPGTLPVKAGTVQLAPGPGGDVYVLVTSVPTGDATIALYGADGTVRDGWPVTVPGWTCDGYVRGTALWSPLVAEDGSVRLVCYLSAQAANAKPAARAFAFDATGRQLAGWPVDLPGPVSDMPRIVEGRLLVVSETRRGAEVTTDGRSWRTQIGPDGITYAVAGSEIRAFDVDGSVAGWPVEVGGDPSSLAFDDTGHVLLTVADRVTGTSRLLVYGRDGRPVVTGPSIMPGPGATAWSGAGPAGAPMAPLVAGDGTVFVVTEANGRAVVYRLDQGGSVMPGWPYRADMGLQWQGSCGEGSVGCGLWRAPATVGADGTLYLPLAAPDAQIGGTLQLVGKDGTALKGWPMHLLRHGAQAWSMVEGSDGTAYALAVEPETGATTSATFLAITRDGTVLSRNTVVEP